MFFQIPEFASYIWISAIDAKPIDFEQILGIIRSKFPNVSVQIVDLDKVAGSRFLFHAALNALRSFNSKRPISRSLVMEILLYIAAERQINEAIKRVGVSPETKRIVAVAIGNSNEEISAVEVFFEQILKERSRDALLDEWSPERVEKVRAIYGVGLKELEATIRKNETPFKAIERLAIERSALLAVRK